MTTRTRTQVRGGIEDVVAAGFPTIEVQNQQELKDSIGAELDQLLGGIYGLLFLAVIVSLFGIVNTLALSIHERTRELGLLRAVGTSRRQVRRIVRYEAVITALIGAVLGSVLGVIFAVLISRPLADEGFTLTIPWLTLVVLLGAGGGRRGARRDRAGAARLAARHARGPLLRVGPRRWAGDPPSRLVARIPGCSHTGALDLFSCCDRGVRHGTHELSDEPARVPARGRGDDGRGARDRARVPRARVRRGRRHGGPRPLRRRSAPSTPTASRCRPASPRARSPAGNTVVAGGGAPYPWHNATDGQATFPTLTWRGARRRLDPGRELRGPARARRGLGRRVRRRRRRRARLPGARRDHRQLRRRADAVGHVALLRGVRRRARSTSATRPTLNAGVARPAMGVFAHEAACVDPVNQRLYLTEDEADGCLYRFTPTDYPDLSAGLLEVAVGHARPAPSTWAEVPEPRAAAPANPTRDQVPGAARFDGGEGTLVRQGHRLLHDQGRRPGLDLQRRDQRDLEILYDDDAVGPDAAAAAASTTSPSRPSGDIFVCEDGARPRHLPDHPGASRSTRFLKLDPVMHAGRPTGARRGQRDRRRRLQPRRRRGCTSAPAQLRRRRGLRGQRAVPADRRGRRSKAPARAKLGHQLGAKSSVASASSSEAGARRSALDIDEPVGRRRDALGRLPVEEAKKGARVRGRPWSPRRGRASPLDDLVALQLKPTEAARRSSSRAARAPGRRSRSSPRTPPGPRPRSTSTVQPGSRAEAQEARAQKRAAPDPTAGRTGVRGILYKRTTLAPSEAGYPATSIWRSNAPCERLGGCPQHAQDPSEERDFRHVEPERRRHRHRGPDRGREQPVRHRRLLPEGPEGAPAQGRLREAAEDPRGRRGARPLARRRGRRGDEGVGPLARRHPLHPRLPAAHGSHRGEARFLLRARPRGQLARRVQRQGADPGRAGRILVPDGRRPRHVRGPRLHRLGPDEPGVHHREPERRAALHPDGVRLVDRRGARRQDPAAALDGRALEDGGPRAEAARRRGVPAGLHHGRPRAGVLPDRRGVLLRPPRPGADRAHAVRRLPAQGP